MKEQECEYNMIHYEDYEPINIEQKVSPSKTIHTNASTKTSEEEPKLGGSQTINK